MALPTPGYNPEASLLQGGTAPILPVQGGGGLGSQLPPDYNPSASLLQGGTGVIEPIRGGAREGVKGVRFGEPEEREYSIEAPPKNVSRATRAYTLEVYGLPVKPTPLSLEPDLSIRQRRLLAYVNQEKKTTLLTTLAAEGAFAYTGYPKYGDCKPSLPINYFTAMARKVHFMDERAHIVWLIPNLRGNKELYETIYDKIIDNYVLPGKEHVLVFTGAFYPDTPNEVSVFLFDEIMKLKQKNPGQVYVLSPANATLLRNGCYILENTYAMKTTLAKQQGKTKEVPTFFEPDILVFPHENILIRSADMPISSDSKVSVGLLARKKIVSKSFYIKPEPGRKSDPAPLERYLTVLSNPNQAETRSWPSKSQQTIRCPPTMDCQNFEVGFPLSVLGESVILNFLESKLYLFHITAEKIPYLTGPKEGKEEEGKEEEEEEEFDVVEEEIQEPPRPPPKVTVPAQKPITGYYKADPSVKVFGKTVTFSLGDSTFTIRVPPSYRDSDPIRVDWMNEKFTVDEAKLLNALQLTPGLMNKAFGVGYRWKLARFLGSLTYSSCFKESSLLLKSECSDARRFLRKVGYILEKDCLENFYKDLGMPREGEVEVVSSEEKPKGDGPPEEETIEETTEEETKEEEDFQEEPILDKIPGQKELLYLGDYVSCKRGDGFLSNGFITNFEAVNGVPHAILLDSSSTPASQSMPIPAAICARKDVTPPPPPGLRRTRPSEANTKEVVRSILEQLNSLRLEEGNPEREAELKKLLGYLERLRVHSV